MSHQTKHPQPSNTLPPEGSKIQGPLKRIEKATKKDGG